MADDQPRRASPSANTAAYPPPQPSYPAFAAATQEQEESSSSANRFAKLILAGVIFGAVLCVTVGLIDHLLAKPKLPTVSLQGLSVTGFDGRTKAAAAGMKWDGNVTMLNPSTKVSVDVWDWWSDIHYGGGLVAKAAAIDQFSLANEEIRFLYPSYAFEDSASLRESALLAADGERTSSGNVTFSLSLGFRGADRGGWRKRTYKLTGRCDNFQMHFPDKSLDGGLVSPVDCKLAF